MRLTIRRLVSEPRLAFNRTVVLRYRIYLEQRHLAPTTINLRWTGASGIKGGCLFRTINKSGQIWGEGMTPKVLWEIVKSAAEAAGIDKLAPDDLRRTCARLCQLAGGELHQIQFFRGHVVHPNHGSLPWLQTEAPMRRERQNRH